MHINNTEFKELVFEKTFCEWNLSKVNPNMWENLKEFDEDAIKTIKNLNLSEMTPYLNNLSKNSSTKIIRPEGSRRAFYIKLNSGGVIAIKGSEIKSQNLKSALEEDACKKLSSRPWTKFENFIFREQKLPLAVTLNEALEDNQSSEQFQSKMLKYFDEFELAPIPLFVNKWSESSKQKYKETILPFLNKRAKYIVDNILDRENLGTSIYYYPHIPFRIRFSLPENCSSFQDRCKSFKNISKDFVDLDPISASENFLKITTKMLVVGLFPLSFHDYGIGQCVAPQNVTIKGGITDMGSIYPFENVRNKKEFHELFLSTFVMLNSSLKELLVLPLPNINYEFNDPSTISILLSKFIWDKIKVYFNKYSQSMTEEHFRMIEPFLGDSPSLDLEKILKNLYPNN